MGAAESMSRHAPHGTDGRKLEKVHSSVVKIGSKATVAASDQRGAGADVRRRDWLAATLEASLRSCKGPEPRKVGLLRPHRKSVRDSCSNRPPLRLSINYICAATCMLA